MTDFSNKSPIEMFYHWEQEAADMVFLRQPIEGQWHEYTWKDVANKVRRVASYINSNNLPAGSRIAIISSNSADWFIVDLAIMLSGHISIPLYPGQDIASAKYILQHSESLMVFVGTFDMSDHADDMLNGLPRVAMLGCSIESQNNLSDIYSDYEPYQQSPIPDHDDIFTMLYTSGTTGMPKGVMHAHGTPAKMMPRLIHMTSGDSVKTVRRRFFSYLPLSHAAERILIEMQAFYSNPTVSFSEGLETFIAELQSVKPTLFFSVPRLWMLFKQKVDAQFPAEVQAQFGDAEKAKVRQQLGLDQSEVIITGSAPLPVDIHQWYLDMGILLRDGYGMTENFIDGCIYSHGYPVPSCVGKPQPGVQLKLTEANEICFKSDGLMKGYYKNPEKTAEVLIDGWYHTGDSGRIDKEGRLWVTGRISEVFKTLRGKFVNPVEIEKKFGIVTELGQLCVIGLGKTQPLLLATLSPSAEGNSREDINVAVTNALTSINESLLKHEQIAQVFIGNELWSIENALLTPTMKLKRHSIEAHFADLIADHLDKEQVVWQ